MDFVASCLVPEGHLLLVVVTMDGGKSVGISLPCVHAVFSQLGLLTGITLQKQSKPTTKENINYEQEERPGKSLLLSLLWKFQQKVGQSKE